ncbi:MAG: hypothetical protein ABIY90_19105 [Puia sp.]
MSQMDFFLSEKERIKVVNFSYTRGFSIIPDLHFRKNSYIVTTNLDEYYEYCGLTPLLFLTSPEYSIHPLQLDFFEDSINGKNFFIRQRYGGPTIDFYSPIAGEKEDGIIGPGYLGIYPFYYTNNGKHVADTHLKNMYKLLTSFIQSISKMVRLKNRTYWVGNHTIEIAKKGDVKLLNISHNNILEGL